MMNGLATMVDECREQGVIDPVDVANRIAERLAAFSKTELVAFISPLLAESVRNVYSRERLDLPKKVHAAKMSGKVQIIRDAYGKVIGLPSSEWKAIGDCNRLELLDYSAMLHGMARQTEAKAQWYERLAERLPNDVVTVREAELDLDKAA